MPARARRCEAVPPQGWGRTPRSGGCVARAAPRLRASRRCPAARSTTASAASCASSRPCRSGCRPGLELEWLGVAGYRLTYEGVSLLVDPYVSRVPLRALLLRRTALPDDALIERYIAAPGAVAGVLVGHTHCDHAVDAPAIARRYGAKAYGSDSLAHLMRLHGLASSPVEVVAAQALRARPVRRALHPQPALQAAVRPQGADRRPADLRAPARRSARAPTGAARSTASGSRSRGSASTTRAAPTSTTTSCATSRSTSSSPASPAAGHAALLGADPAAARPARRRPDALRRLLRAARAAADVRAPGRARRAAGRDRGGLLRRARRGAGAHRRGPARGLNASGAGCQTPGPASLKLFDR